MDRRQQFRGADGLQVAVDALNEAMRWRRRVLVDLAQGRATRAMYEDACDREARLRETWDRLSNAYYAQWCQDTRRQGLELTGWIMGRIKQAVGLDEEPVSG
jgi:hypothetical protein